LDNTSGNVDRVADTASVSLANGAEFNLTGNGTTNSTETVGAIGLGAGNSIITVASATGRVTTLAASGLSRTNNGTGLVRGASLNQSVTTNVSRITLGTVPSGADFVGTNTLNNGGTAESTQALKIIPWLIGDTATGSTGSNFVTYDSTLGLRVLQSTEQQTLTAGYTTAANHDNVNAGTNITLTNASGVAVNSLLFNATSALNSANSNSLTVDSGAVALVTNNAASIGSGFSSLVLGNGEGVFHVTQNTLTVNTPVDVTSSGGLTKSGGGILVLGASNLYTGVTTVNQGTLQIGTGAAGDLGSNTANIVVNPGATLLFGRTSGVLTLANNISGAGAVTQNGSGGTTVLSGSNTYSGATTLTAGTLQAVANAGNTASGVSSALSAGSAISFASGATMQLRSDSNVTFSNGAITLNSDTSAGVDTTSFNFDVGPATSASNKTITLGTVQFTNTTSGNRGQDLQTINLTGASGYTLAITNALGQSSNGQSGNNYFYNVASGLTLAFNGGINGGVSTNHTFQGAGNYIVGQIFVPSARTQTMIFNQTGTVALNSAASAAGGTLNNQFNAGTTVLNNAAALNNNTINLGNQTASSTADATALLGGGAGGLTGGLTYTGAVKVYDTTSGLLTLGGQNTSGTNTFSNAVTLGNTANTGKSVNLVAAAGGQVNFTNAINKNGTDTTAGVTINGAYTVNGATVNPSGTVRLAGANTYGGTTTIANGTLLADSAQALNTTAAGGNITFTGGTLKLGSTFNAGANADISPRIKNSSSAIAIDTNSLSSTFASALDSSNTGGLTKSGAGTLTLTGANTYTGATVVSSGTLAVGIGGSIAGTTGIAVKTGATFDTTALTSFTVGSSQTLSGGGTVNAQSLVVNGTLAPHDSSSTISTMQINNSGSLTLANGAQFALNIGATTGDSVSASGSVNLGATSTDRVALSLSLVAQPVDGTTYIILNSSSVTNNGLFSFNGTDLNNGDSFTVSSGGFNETFVMNYGGTGDFLTAMAVPEPSTWAMVLGGFGSLILTRNLRRRKI